MNDEYLGMFCPTCVRAMACKNSELMRISGLITSMLTYGATRDEIAKIFHYCRALVDPEMNKADLAQSAIDNDIAALKQKYSCGYACLAYKYGPGVVQ